MNAEQLKNSILQRAIEGKLVEQREEEGTAAELLREIKAEKARLVKEGKLKKEKPLPEIKAEEIPFEIPESWEWVRLGEIINLLSGRDMQPSEYNHNSKGIPYLTGASNLSDGSTIINRWTETPQTIAYKGDLLVTCKGTIGKTCILKENKVHIARQIMAIRPYINIISYIHIYLLLYIGKLKTKAKSIIPGVERKDILSALVPLPPLAEQKRIVAKIEELLPHVERYGKAHDELTALNAKFPEAMKKSVLQYAMEGKLVEQRAEEGTAKELLKEIKAEKARLVKEGKLKKEKPLPEIKAEEIPFEIPESWEWVRLGEIGSLQTGNTPSKLHPEYFGNYIAFVSPGDINDGNITYRQEGLSQEGYTYGRIAQKKSILQVCIGGSIGKAAITSMDVAFNQQINSITPYFVNSKYIYFIFASNTFSKYLQKNATGTATPIINKTTWGNSLIPLPPLAEQKRIVAKIEELLVCCGALEK